MWNIKCYSLLLLTFSWMEINGTQEWDYLIFTQHWPPTVCADWEKKDPGHACSMLETPDEWTIHGVWPSKISRFGPQFCNKTWLFDPEEVRPIEGQLEKYWANIEGGTGLYDLWAHEWNKHGTCAAELEPLNSQLKYFSKGLAWLKQYPLSKILAARNIVPSDEKEYTMSDFYNAVKAEINMEPQIECRTEKGGKQYLFEIRLCFTKKLEPVDCSVAMHFEVMGLTSCFPPGITYPATYKAPKRYLVNWYKLTNFLQWFTL